MNRIVRHIQAEENYSAIKKKEILAFVTTWINLENIVLCATLNKTSTLTCSHLYACMENLKKLNF